MEDRARGCFMGVLVGDAAGAPLEFQREVTLPGLSAALRMRGGGLHAVGPGQVTDDSELAMCLALGLLEGGPAAVPKWYARWLRSEPFDAGRTCRMAFCQRPEDMAATARAHSANSKANDALMRIAPAAIWGRHLPEERLVDLVRGDAALSHPNATTQDCNAAYAIAVRHLLLHPGDAGGALVAAADWANYEAVPEVRGWLEDSRELSPDVRCCENSGFVRWAFTLAFWHLSQRTPFVGALADTLSRAGDTDTNGAIVGGMMGAYWGIGGIPADMRGRVLAFDAALDGGHARPAWLCQGRVLAICDALLSMR